MDLSFEKYISIVYRPGLLSSGLDAVLGKGRGLMRSIRFSQEDLSMAGIILGDEGRDGQVVFPSTTSDLSTEQSS